MIPDREVVERLYVEEQLSLREVGERCGVSGSAVQAWLKKHEIPMRNKSQARLIALSKNKFPGMVHRGFDRGFFSEWSPEMSYLLGLVFADGHVNEFYVRFAFGEPSFDILRNIKKIVGYDGPLVEYDNHGYPAMRMTLSSIEMTGDLRWLGIPWSNKSRTKVFPALPEGLESHFVRGYFDGNGSVGAELVRVRCGSWDFIYGLKDCVARCVPIVGVGNVYTRKPKMVKFPQGREYWTKESYALAYATGQDHLTLYHWFYDDAPEFCYSPRKQSMFRDLVGLPGEAYG